MWEWGAIRDERPAECVADVEGTAAGGIARKWEGLSAIDKLKLRWAS